MVNFKFRIVFLLLTKNSYSDLIKPSINLKAIDVLNIQLKSLKNNNKPYADAGIEQTWEFAHPYNKFQTGPLENFKKMIYSKNYEILIKHVNSKVTLISKTKNKSVYKVSILSKDKKKYNYTWQLEKVLFDGSLKNCWMTINVSNPQYIGDII